MVDHDFLLVTDTYHRGIYQVDLYSNFKPEALRLNGVKNPIGVSFDPVERMVYWTDVEKREVNRASLDGSRQDTIAIENIGRKKDKPSTDYRKPGGVYYYTFIQS